MYVNPLADDLQHILNATATLWDDVRGQRIFITGGTGFFGCWLLESFVWANTTLKLNAHAVILTRNIARFAKKCPDLFLESSLSFQEGNVIDFIFPDGQFAYVIHAATDACVSLNKESPELMQATIVQGTQRVLEFSRHCQAISVLLTSSGAVYGRQPHDMTHVSEDHWSVSSVADTIHSAYADGKREAEKLCAQYANAHQLKIKIARCFAFVGPYLPLDTHFAIGNFIRDGLNHDVIRIHGDGSPYRSYLYAADLAVWLWTILLRGENMRPYNVGSDESVTIKELAELVADTVDLKCGVYVEQPVAECMPERYVPDVSRARIELKLDATIDLRQAIALTQQWHLGCNHAN
jgi:nucleoside-diphosphate-sugar epimerase